MTGPSGNKLSVWPPQEFLLTSVSPRSIGTLGEAILNLSGQIDLPITLETSHYLFNIAFYMRVFNFCAKIIAFCIKMLSNKTI